MSCACWHCIACSVTVSEFGLVAFSAESLVPTHNRMMFMDIRRPKFVHVQPSLGTMNGDSIVNFFCSDFSNSPGLACKFGFRSSKCVWLGLQLIQCKSRVFIAGLTPISVAFDGFEYLQTNVSFFFYAAPVVASVYPSFGDFKGRTPVTLSGAHFFNSSLAFFSFAGSTVPLQSVISSSKVTCKSPGTMNAGAVAVEVSFNGVDVAVYFIVRSTCI